MKCPHQPTPNCKPADLLNAGRKYGDLSDCNIRKLAKNHADRIVSNARANRTSLIVELHRFERDRVRDRIEIIRDIQSAINTAVWIEVVNMRDYRSDRADWVLA
jgi:hypothetical protein